VIRARGALASLGLKPQDTTGRRGSADDGEERGGQGPGDDPGRAGARPADLLCQLADALSTNSQTIRSALRMQDGGQ
jgi:hypothetical protein